MVNVDVDVQAWCEDHVNNLKPRQIAGEFKGVTSAEILLVLGPDPKLTLVVISFPALFINRHLFNLPLFCVEKNTGKLGQMECLENWDVVIAKIAKDACDHSDASNRHSSPHVWISHLRLPAQGYWSYFEMEMKIDL